MAEDEVNYASVVFKSKNHPPPEATKEETVYGEVKGQSKTNKPTADTNPRNEETVYDEVKGRSKTTEETADTNGLLLEKKANSRRLQCQRLACCLGILCVILLLVIIAVVVIYHLAANRNLTNLNNNNISLDIENLRRDKNSLTVQLGNLTKNYTVLESKFTDLTADVQNLTTRNQNLTTQNQDLTTRNQQLDSRIQELETQMKNYSQWSIDVYCPKTSNVVGCQTCLTQYACQTNFGLNGANCYVIYNDPSQKTWEEARQVCRGRSSDLVVVHSQEEQDELNKYGVGVTRTDGFWIGLRAEGGRWKWIDGSDLTLLDTTTSSSSCCWSVCNICPEQELDISEL